MKKYATVLLVAMITGSLLGCHGGEDSSSGVSSVSPSSVTSASCTALTQQIGAGTSQSFTASSLTIGLSPLSAGGSTSVTANVVDCANNPYTPPVLVSFSSTCTGLGTAQIDSPIITNNGTAITTYVAKGCQGNDTVIATAVIDSPTPDVNDLNLIAAGTVNVLPAAAGSIEFVSATPELISLKGTGGVGLTENSTVVFKVSDVSGGPVSNQAVTFSLSTTVGGLSLSTSTGTTNANGRVQTVVQAGTIPTAVRVTATVTGSSPVIASQSDQLVVSTGLPDANSFSLTLENHSPEVWEEYIGCDPEIKESDLFAYVYLADQFNNPVPDGTAVTFTAEGGQIEDACNAQNGVCRVRWCSTYPRPADGRVTIMATALGVESFTDSNGNGVFDDGESFTDLPEAYRDDNENSTFDVGTDVFVDFNVNGMHDAADSEYNGVLCNPLNTTTPCSVNKTLNVSASTILIMASSNPILTPNPLGAIDVSGGGSQVITFSIADARNQRPPSGTTIGFSVSNGKVIGIAQDTVLDSTNNGPFVTAFTVEGDTTPSNDGGYTLTITLPRGKSISYFERIQD